MDAQIEHLHELGKELEKRPVWDKLGEAEADPQDMFAQFYKHRKVDSVRGAAPVIWHTTNSEYGQFSSYNLKNKQKESSVSNVNDISRSVDWLGNRSGSYRDPGASARSRADSASNNQPVAIPGYDCYASNQPDSGLKLPAIDPKYLPIQNRPTTNRFPTVPPKRLTTGFAKSYMRSSCTKLWDNMQTIAEGAGLQTTPASRPDTQVLKIDYPQNDEYEDEALQAQIDELLGRNTNSDDVVKSASQTPDPERGYRMD